MSVCGHKVKILTGDLKDTIAFCTYSDGEYVRVTPVNGDELASLEFKIDDVRIITINDCGDCPR